MNRINFIREIFALTFLLTRKWEIIFNRQSDELTLKQMMMLIVIKNAFEGDPTLKALAAALSTSHQNAKAITKQLEKKSFVTIYTDDKDKRVSRISINMDKEAYWEARNTKDTESLSDLFEGINENDLAITARTIFKLNENADKRM